MRQEQSCHPDDQVPTYLQERARRRERSRQRVEHVALELFGERGFAAVTVEEVCAQAGIAVATFYRYFGSKEDAFFSYEPEFLEQVHVCVTAVDPERRPGVQVLTFVDRFAMFLETQAEALARRDDLVRAEPALQARTAVIQRRWEVELVRCLAERRGRATPNDDDQLDAALCLDVLRIALRTWRRDSSVTLSQAAQRVVAQARERLS